MTKVNALLMNVADNVVTTVAEIAKGKEVVYEKDGDFPSGFCVFCRQPH